MTFSRCSSLTVSDDFKTSTPQRNRRQVNSFDSTRSLFNQSLSMLLKTDLAAYDFSDDPSFLLTPSVKALINNKATPSSDSNSDAKTSNASSVKRRKSTFRRRRSIVMAFKRSQVRHQKEKRNAAFNQIRQMSVGQSDAFQLSIQPTNATYFVESMSTKTSISLRESQIEEQEINAFHNEIGQCGVIEDFTVSECSKTIALDGKGTEVFEKLCNVMESEHPYEHVDLRSLPISVSLNAEESNCQSNVQSESLNPASKSRDGDATAASMASVESAVSVATKGSCQSFESSPPHQHRIPRIVKYKSQTQICQTFDKDGRGFIREWNQLSFTMKIYLISVSIGFVCLFVQKMFDSLL